MVRFQGAFPYVMGIIVLGLALAPGADARTINTVVPDEAAFFLPTEVVITGDFADLNFNTPALSALFTDPVGAAKPGASTPGEVLALSLTEARVLTPERDGPGASKVYVIGGGLQSNELPFTFTGGGQSAIAGLVKNNISGRGIEGVAVELSAESAKAIAFTQTSESGAYGFPGIEDTQLYHITFAKPEYLPGELSDVAAGSTDANIGLVPVEVTTPGQPIAFSGPKSVFLEWDANPEYNLQGYTVWRTATDEAGTPQGPAEAVSDLLEATEYTDGDTVTGQYYIYQIQALSAADRPSALSPASTPVKAQFLTVFFPEVFIDNTLDSLYLWDLQIGDLTFQDRVRMPISTFAAYEIGSAAMDIVAELPNDIVLADTGPDILVQPTGITEGMIIAFNINANNELVISAADAQERDLYGSGVLFDVYAQIRGQGGCPDPGVTNLTLVEDTFDPGPPVTGREGVLLRDIDTNIIDLELENGVLCVEQGTCIHGDVDGDQDIDVDDVQLIAEIKAELVDIAQLQNADCLPWAADINLDGRVDAADGSQILRWLETGSLNPPPQKLDKAERMAYAYAAYDKQAGQPTVEVDYVSGLPGAAVQATVTIDSQNSTLPLAGFTLVVTYPAGEEGLSFVSGALDSALAADYELAVNSETTGNGLFGAAILTASDSSGLGAKGPVDLAVLTFTLGAKVPANLAIPLKVSSFESNDALGFTPRHDAPGQAMAVDTALPPQAVLTVSMQGDGTTTPEAGKAAYDEDEEVNLTATPAADFEFDRWIGDVADAQSASTSVTMDDDKQIEAVFVQKQRFTLTTNVTGLGVVNPSSGTYDPGAQVTIVATPANNWAFSEWQGDATGTANPLTITMDANKTITAVFIEAKQGCGSCAPVDSGGKSPWTGDLLVLLLATAGLMTAHHRQNRCKN